MKYTLRTTNKFEKSVKRCIRRNCPMDELRKVMSLLVETGTLPTTYHPHKLQGKKVLQQKEQMTSTYLPYSLCILANLTEQV